MIKIGQFPVLPSEVVGRSENKGKKNHKGRCRGNLKTNMNKSYFIDAVGIKEGWRKERIFESSKYRTLILSKYA